MEKIHVNLLLFLVLVVSPLPFHLEPQRSDISTVFLEEIHIHVYTLLHRICVQIVKVQLKSLQNNPSNIQSVNGSGSLVFTCVILLYTIQTAYPLLSEVGNASRNLRMLMTQTLFL